MSSSSTGTAGTGGATISAIPTSAGFSSGWLLMLRSEIAKILHDQAVINVSSFDFPIRSSCPRRIRSVSHVRQSAARVFPVNIPNALDDLQCQGVFAWIVALNSHRKKSHLPLSKHHLRRRFSDWGTAKALKCFVNGRNHRPPLPSLNPFINEAFSSDCQIPSVGKISEFLKLHLCKGFPLIPCQPQEFISYSLRRIGHIVPLSCILLLFAFLRLTFLK